MRLVHHQKVATAGVPPQQRVKEFAGEHLALCAEREAVFFLCLQKRAFYFLFPTLYTVFSCDVLGSLSKS